MFLIVSVTLWRKPLKSVAIFLSFPIKVNHSKRHHGRMFVIDICDGAMKIPWVKKVFYLDQFEYVELDGDVHFFFF